MLRIKKYIDRIKIKSQITKNRDNLKIIIGSAKTSQEGWVSTNYPILDLLDNKTFSILFKKVKVKCFLAEHVWEHLTTEEGMLAASNCYNYLDENGILRIAVPDSFHSNQEYIEYVKPNGHGVGSDAHKVFYNYKSLESLLLNSGFKVRKLEWFDEFRTFHFNRWNIADGFIRRSVQFDRRNSENSILYTSLIIDGIKC